MKLTIHRLSALTVQFQRYLPVMMMAITVLGFVMGFRPLDTEGGTGH